MSHPFDSRRPFSRRLAAFCLGAGLVLLLIAVGQWGISAQAQSPALGGPAPATPEEAASAPAQDRIIQSLAQQMDDKDIFDDDQRKEIAPARRQMQTADAILTRIRSENHDALAQATRQLRLRCCEKFNIILIVLDDIGWNDLGCYGQKQIKTPNIDRLAHEGVRFTNYYAGSSLGVPSRGSMWSGYHTGRGRQEGEDWLNLRRADHTIAESLWQAGYCTALIGKWGVGNRVIAGDPNEQGFDYFFGFRDRLEAENHYPTMLWRNREQVPIASNDNDAKQRYANDLFTQEAISYIQNHGGSSRPYFLSLCYTADHANKKEFERTGNGMEVPTDAPYTDEGWAAPEKNKAAMITRVDTQIGDVMNALADVGADRSTIVILTSDNGPHQEGGVNPEFHDSNGPLRGIKGDLYEGGIRVPMIIWGHHDAGPACAACDNPQWQVATPAPDAAPGSVYVSSGGKPAGPTAMAAGVPTPKQPIKVLEFPRPADGGAAATGAAKGGPARPMRGYDSDHVWSAYDLHATLCGLVNALHRPRQSDGLNMAPLFAGAVAPEHRFLYWETHHNGDAVAVRMGKWKGIKQGAAWELYDLSADQEETHDVSGQNRDIINDMQAIADEAHRPR